MPLKAVNQFVLCLMACIGFASCNFVKPQVLNSRSSLASSSSAKQDEFAQFAALMRDHLYNERFSLLDSTASQLRVNKERFPGGAWKLNAFYGGLNEPASGDQANEAEWKGHLDKLHKWADQAPNSLLPA